MNKTLIKQISIAIILAVSITGNIFYFGNKEVKEYREKIFQEVQNAQKEAQEKTREELITQGQVQVINAIVAQVKKTGQIEIKTDDITIILIEKK